MIKNRKANNHVVSWMMVLFPGLVLGFGFSTDPLKEAQVCLENGSFEKALLLLNEELKRHPKNEIALVMRGEAFHSLKKYQESIQDFSSALEINPNSKNALLGRAISMFVIHREAESIADLKRLLEKDPNDFKARIWIAKCNIDIKNLDEALVHINKALKISKDFQDPYMLRAQIGLVNKDFYSVIDDTSRAMSLTKKIDGYYNPFRERGAAYVHLNLPDLAILDLIKAYEKDKTDFNILDYLTNAYCQKDYYDKGIETISSAIALKPKSPYLLYKRAGLYENIGDYKKAIRDLEKALEVIRNEPLYLLKKADLEVKAGLFNEAIAAIKNEPLYFFKKADLEVKAGLFKEAIADYSEALEGKTGWALPFVSRGRVYERIGEIDKALDDFSKAFQLTPDDYQILLSIGMLHLKKERFELAIESFSKCIQMNPMNPEAYLFRSNSYKCLGNEQKALADLAEVKKIATFPNNK